MLPGWLQILIVVLLLVVLLGRGKISKLMSDLAQGIKRFRTGIAEDNGQVEKEAAKTVEDKSKIAAKTSRRNKAKS